MSRPDKAIEAWTVPADAAGAFSTPYTPTPSIPGRFKITATDGTNVATSAATEADALGIDFKQAANNESKYGLGNVEWIGSILQANDSIYYEGMSVMQRAVLYGIAATAGDNTHSLAFSHEAEKSGNAHAYDFLTSWDQAVAAANAISPGGGLLTSINADGQEIEQSLDKTHLVPQLLASLNYVDVDCPDGMGTLLGGDVAAKIAAYESAFGNRTIRIYALAPITAASLTFDGYVAGFAHYHLNWTSESTSVYIEFAGHIAIGGDGTNPMGYGVGLGASDINGGPYHFKLDNLDGTTIGSQDNQLMGASVLVQPGYIIVDKVTNPAGSPQSFAFTPTGSGYNGFSLTDADAPHDSGPLAPGTYTVTEGAVAGWDLTSITGGADTMDVPMRTATIVLGAGETVNVTFTNTLELGSLDVTKLVSIPAGVINPSAITDTFTAKVTGPSYPAPAGITQVFTYDGTTVSPNPWHLGNLIPGSYVVTETIKGVTYSWTDLVTGTGTVTAGGTAAVTITNTFVPARIIVDKVTKPVGDPQLFEFDPSWLTTNFFLADATTPYSEWLIPGEYSVSEVNIPAGWVLTGISVNGTAAYTANVNTLTASITLAAGDVVTVTFEDTAPLTTRTQGFWATHLTLSDAVWFGSTAGGHKFTGLSVADQTFGNHVIDSDAKLMAAFWANVAKTSTGAKRSALDQARMQLLQQLIAAMLNNAAFGSSPTGSVTIAQAKTAFLTGNLSQVKAAMSAMASFNESGDSGAFTPGVSANGKLAKDTAAPFLGFWDVLP